MIETLFFQCYYAYLLGDLSKTEKFYALLREEFKKSGQKDSLEFHQYIKLKKVKNALDSGNISKKQWVDNIDVPQIVSDMTIKQKELVKKIHVEGLDQLKSILNDNVEIYNIEHPCTPYGAVDMVYKGKDTIYPVEVKRGKGEHDLIGQIEKYDLFHCLRLHYKHYKQVQSVTICHSYHPFTAQELRMMGVLPLMYKIIDKQLYLSSLASK